MLFILICVRSNINTYHKVQKMNTKCKLNSKKTIYQTRLLFVGVLSLIHNSGINLKQNERDTR